MPPLAIGAGVGALAGALGGAIKKGPDLQTSALQNQAQGASSSALTAYQNLAAAGPGQTDVTAALNASRGYATTLGNFAQNGLQNQQQGNLLADQQFAGRRTALEQNFQDQMGSANRQAAISGRGASDPILRARLAVEQTRQSNQLQADQSSAAGQLGRQFSMDQISLGGQQVNTLQGLSQQAYGNQQNLFNMGQLALTSERENAFKVAGYEAGRGGGVMGAITGALGGASAGISMAGSISSMLGQQALTKSAGGLMDAQAKSIGAGSSYAPMGAQAPQAAPFQNPGAIYPQTEQQYINSQGGIFGAYGAGTAQGAGPGGIPNRYAAGTAINPGQVATQAMQNLWGGGKY